MQGSRKKRKQTMIGIADSGSTKTEWCFLNEAGEEQKQEIEFSIEIKEMVLETDGEPTDETQEPAFQWWVTILVGFAIIAVIVSVVVVTKVLRNSKIKWK